MSEKHDVARSAPAGPWVIDTKDIGRAPGSSHRVTRRPAAPAAFGLDMVRVPEGDEIELSLRLESVVEGILVTGSIRVPTEGECVRCLDPVGGEVEAEFRELFAYPDSATDESTDEDEVSRITDDLIDLEPVVRDTVLTTLEPDPLCTPDCPGLCAGCGAKWVELDPDHKHEMIDPRWAPLREWFGGSEEEN